jgi:rRNA maturation protein Nop10
MPSIGKVMIKAVPSKGKTMSQEKCPYCGGGEIGGKT